MSKSDILTLTERRKIVNLIRNQLTQKNNVILISIFGSFLSDDFIVGISDMDIGVIVEDSHYTETLILETYIENIVNKIIPQIKLHITFIKNIEHRLTLKIFAGEVLLSVLDENTIDNTIEDLMRWQRVNEYYRINLLKESNKYA